MDTDSVWSLDLKQLSYPFNKLVYEDYCRCVFPVGNGDTWSSVTAYGGITPLFDTQSTTDEIISEQALPLIAFLDLAFKSRQLFVDPTEKPDYRQLYLGIIFNPDTFC